MADNDLNQHQASVERDSAPRIAYLTGEYPRATDTFIQREVFALRELGADVLTCSIRQTASIHDVGKEQRGERANTFYVLRNARNPLRLLASHARMFLRAPGRWFSALRLALRICPPGIKAGIWQLSYLAEAGVLAHHLLDRRIEHLHCHSADSSGTVSLLASEISGVPFSITLHGPGIFFEPRWWRIDEKIARASFVACISHFCRSQAMLFSDQTHWAKLRIVHCGVAPENYGRGLGQTPGKHVLFVGRLDPVKGVTLLLEAFANSRASHPDARLTVVGDGPARAALEVQASKLGISGVTSFTGYRSQADVAALLEEADMLVLPSFAEGVPVVLMEAMASGKPVIASQVGGVAELVEDGLSGFLVPPGNLDLLTSKLVTLLSDPDMCREMGLVGRKLVADQFNVEREAAWLLSLFEGHGEGIRWDAEQASTIRLGF